MVQLCIRTLLCLALLAGNTLHASVFTRPGAVEAGERVYLNPNTGRFWTRDTVEGDQEDPKSLHLYNYASDNPMIKVDPSGHDDIVDVLSGLDIDASLNALQGLTDQSLA